MIKPISGIMPLVKTKQCETFTRPEIPDHVKEEWKEFDKKLNDSIIRSVIKMYNDNRIQDKTLKS